MQAVACNSVDAVLDSASENDLLLAAETVVDAAIRCHSIRYNVCFSERAREKMVHEVHADPGKIQSLFDPVNFGK